MSTAYCARVSHVSSDPVIAFLQGLTVRQENGQLIIDRITDESPVAKQGAYLLKMQCSMVHFTVLLLSAFSRQGSISV